MAVRLTASSPTIWQTAVQGAIDRASKTLRGLNKFTKKWECTHKKLEKITIEEELHICLECGYEDGYHTL
jgi:flavin-binding protein dodecin